MRFQRQNRLPLAHKPSRSDEIRAFVGQSLLAVANICDPATVPSSTPPLDGIDVGATLHPSASLTTSGRGGPPHQSPPHQSPPHQPPPHQSGPHRPEPLRSGLLRSSLDQLNEAPARTAEALFLGCCRSRRWAERLAAHRPYPDPDALLAAADEASYDLSVPEIADALTREVPPGPRADTPPAAQTALLAAHDTYERRFGHSFVICLDAYAPEEHLDQVLAGIRFRLGNERDEERAVAADELRRLARGRLTRLVREPWTQAVPRAASPSVAV